jgi:hypothetical protein
MKAVLFNRVSLLVLLLALSCGYVLAQTDHTPLNNAAIVKLVKAGFKEKTIISIIASRPANFDLSTDRMIELKRSGVTEKLILAMLARQEGMEFDDEAWSDEAFMNGGGNQSGSTMSNQQKAPQNSNGNTVDIFGNSGGSKGTTKQRGANGENSGDTMTTGSATVRILRPPSEAGAPTKLEKTPSLTNDMVVELVEAGFSEGTIVRRIEQSPVAFDLSPEKLAELRRHRVSEKILTAMKAAMGIDATPEKTPARATGNATPRQ